MYFDEAKINLNQFNSATHLSNHLNYLIHTDKEQKYTNKFSVNNLTLLKNDANQFDSIIWDDNLDNRKKLKNEIFNRWRLDYRELYYVRVECRNEDVFHWNSKMVEEMMEIIQEIEKNHYKVLLCEIHDDQPEYFCHFHLICRECTD